MKCHSSHIRIFNKYYVPTIRSLLSKKNSASDSDSSCLLKSCFKFKSPFLFLLSLTRLKAKYTFHLGPCFHLKPTFSMSSPPRLRVYPLPLPLLTPWTHPFRKHTSIYDFSVGVTISALEMVVFLFLEHPTIAPHWVTLDPPNHSCQGSFLSSHWLPHFKEAKATKPAVVSTNCSMFLMTEGRAGLCVFV